MAAYIIGFILVIIVLIIVGLILRKRVYDKVDRLESWKMDITNRNTASQLSRIKRLNLSGETQQKFETWKERWEYIVTKELPDVEEHLFDAEEEADKYRFPSAHKVLKTAEEVLDSIENDLKNMLGELDNLLDSEKTSREELAHIEPEIKTLRNVLSENRHRYGRSKQRFEGKLDELDEQLATFDELREAGDYHKAKQVMDQVREELDAVRGEMDAFPEAYKACNDTLPSQLDEIYQGLQQMKTEGYRVENLGMEEDIRNYKQRLQDCVGLLENEGVSEARPIIQEIEESIQEMYVILEKEAIAKNYIETQMPNYEEALGKLSSSFQETKKEVESLQQSYYLKDGEWEQFMSLDKMITQMEEQFQEVAASSENREVPHTELREQIEYGFEQVKKLEDDHVAFREVIQNLRKDELAAKEQLSSMKTDLQALQRKLRKSNIPGVPSFIWNMMEDTIRKNDRVLELLEKKPLNISEVQQSLNDAKESLDQFSEQTNLMLEQAYLTERVIQYANRYRSKYPELGNKLAESERLFRSSEYELALEQAAEAVEEVEPGALKRIEADELPLSGFAK